MVENSHNIGVKFTPLFLQYNVLLNLEEGVKLGEDVIIVAELFSCHIRR